MTHTTRWPQLENRMLVYDPQVAQLTIEKTGKVKNDHESWTLNLDEPTKDIDCWDLFIDSKGEKVSARRPDQEIPKDGYFIARLNLQTLGVKGRFLRKHGKLQTVRVIKPSRQINCV